MNTFLARSLFVGACLLGASLCPAADEPETLTPAPSDRTPPVTPVPDHYIVQVAGSDDPAGVAAAHALAPRFVYRAAIRGFAAMIPPGQLAAVRADPRVQRVSPDHRVTAIGKPAGNGGTTNDQQIPPEGVKRIGAHNIGTTGAGIGVAIVDTGVDLVHRDLPGARHGFSAYGDLAQDDHGHGTHVAGTVAAANNAFDVIGVAPAAAIYAVKVLDASGSGSDSSVIAGLNWVVANAATVAPAIKVVNMSLGRGTTDDDSAFHDAVKRVNDSGIAVVVAAGNDARLEISAQVPACFPEAIAVASTTATDGRNQSRFYSGIIAKDTASYFTTDGPRVAISAPGEDREDIAKSGFIQSVGILSLRAGGGTTRMSGTSMAAPHVAGVAALILEKYPSSTVAQVRARIENGDRKNAAPLPSPTSSYSADGVLEGVVYVPNALAP